MSQARGWTTGNAREDANPFRGWLLGHFVPEGLRHSDAVEVKWGTYAAGFGESDWTACQTGTSLVVLASGRHEIELPQQVVTLEQPGDYLIWGPGVPHRWRALEDCVVMTVRWPSIPGDTIDVPAAEIERMRTD